MTHHQLGHADKARELLGELRHLARPSAHATDNEVQSFLHEAEALIEPASPAGGP